MTRGSIDGRSFDLGAVYLYGPPRSVLFWVEPAFFVARLAIFEKLDVGDGGAPVWQRGWPAIHLWLAFALEAGKDGANVGCILSKGDE